MSRRHERLGLRPDQQRHLGFAASQAAYDANVGSLFEALTRLEAELAGGHGGPFLLRDHMAEADVRAYTTLARFDVAYVPVMLRSA